MRKSKRNITIINNEIDYDKLAEAIVKAQNHAKENKRTTSKFRSAAMGLLNGTVYAIVYIIAFYFIYVVWAESYSKQNSPLVNCIIITLILVFIGIYAFFCQQESRRDTDSDIREHFNTNISLTALVVAVIALFKGV